MTEPVPHSASIPAPAKRLWWAVKVAGFFLVVLGATVAGGWFLHVPQLVQMQPGQEGTVFNSALGFILAGTALLLPADQPALRRRGQEILGGLIVLMAGAVLAQHFLKIDLGIDQQSLHSWLADPNPTPGRMAPNTALAFALGGLALILMQPSTSRVSWRATEILSFLVVFIGLTGAVGYAMKLEFLYDWYHYTHMAINTAVGITVFGVGLWGAWRQLPDSRSLLPLRAQTRIIWIGSSIFFVIAVIAGLGGFAIMQQRTETTLENGLVRSLQNRSDFFVATIDETSRLAQLVATRPAIYRHLHILNAEPDNAAELAQLNTAARSFLPLGFTGLAFYDKRGRELVRAGVFVQRPDLAVTLALPYPARLLWEQGFLFEARLPMREAGQYLGTAVVVAQMDVLTRMLHDTRNLGDTGEMAVCAAAAQRSMWCFPLRFSPGVQQLPYEIGGRRLPMSYALEGQSGVITAFDYRRQNVTAAYGPIGTLGLGMVVKTDTAELYQPIGDQLRWVMLLLLLLFAIGIWILRLLVMPLVRRVVASEEKYRTVAETAHESIVTANAGGCIVFWNRGAETAFGYTESQIHGQPLTRLMPERYRESHRQGWEQLRTSGRPRLLGKTIELHGLRRDGQEFPLELSLSSWQGADGEQYYTGVIRDISRRKQAEEAARHLANIVESSSDAIISKDMNDTITSWNAAAERLYGYRAADIIGKPGALLYPPDKAGEEQDLLERLRRTEHVERFDTVRLRQDGGAVEVAITVSPLHDASGHLVGTSTIARDITERRRREAQARALAVTDELTGLHNRRGFATIAEQQFRIARRTRVPLHIGFIDLDGMKAINDRFGHAVGDQAIKDTADILRASFRDSDVLARLGGDEFVVLAIGAGDETIEHILARLFATVTRANQNGQRPYALSLSVGVVHCDTASGMSLDQMIEEADRRMYRAKTEKRRTTG